MLMTEKCNMKYDLIEEMHPLKGCHLQQSVVVVYLSEHIKLTDGLTLVVKIDKEACRFRNEYLFSFKAPAM